MEIDDSTKSKSPKSNAVEEPHFDEIHNSTDEPEAQENTIRHSQTIALHPSPSSDGSNEVLKKSDTPVVTPRLSRAEAVRQDARKLKSATLNRMGKMFKQRSQTPVPDKATLNDGGIINDKMDINKSIEACNNNTTKKEKSNSLGRMLKLVDKDGPSKKLFHPRAGSLSRILRRHPSNERSEKKTTAQEDNTPGIFSRMLNQLRGRPSSGNATAEPNIKTRNKMGSLPPKVPIPSRTPNLPPTTPAAAPQSPVAETSQKIADFQYSI